METNVIKLFHGTDRVSAIDIVNNGADIFRSRPDGDFGYGFYATTERGQAWNWADSKRGIPAVVSFYLDTSKVNGITLTGNAWKEYIFQNRVHGAEMNYQDVYKKFDYIEGSLADGKPVQAAIQYKAGLINKELFFRMLGNPNGYQLVLKTIKALRNMKFVSLDDREEEPE